jgi:hypothetical protein
MTTPGAPHPDDEALSGLLDGEAAPATRDHIATCAPCRVRLERLAVVRAAIGAPVAVGEAAVEASVAAAMAGWDGAAVVPLTRRRRLHAPPPAWIGVAAVVLALLAAVPLLLRGGDEDGLATTFRSKTSTEARLDESSKAGAVAGAEAAVADFGAHNDTATLVALLDTGEYQAPPPAATQASGERTASAEAPDGTAESCIDEGRRVAAGRAGTLVTTGPVTWRGEEAVVVVFAVDDDGGGQGSRQLYVMTRVGCDLLAEQRF